MVAAHVDGPQAMADEDAENKQAQARASPGAPAPAPGKAPSAFEAVSVYASPSSSPRNSGVRRNWAPNSSGPLETTTEDGAVDQMSDEFGVLKLIDEGPQHAGPNETMNGRNGGGPPSPRSTGSSNGTPGEAQSASLTWARGSSPLGFASPFSPDDASLASARGSPEKKSRRWTVNIPSLSHFADDSSKGLFLPPNDDGTSNIFGGASGSMMAADSLSSAGNSDGGSAGSPPGFDRDTDFFPLAQSREAQRQQQLEEMQEEEERLRLRLQMIQEKKQQVETSMLPPPPPPPGSPPPSPPMASPPGLAVPPSFDDHLALSMRRHSHMDSTGASSWGQLLGGPSQQNSGNAQQQLAQLAQQQQQQQLRQQQQQEQQQQLQHQQQLLQAEMSEVDGLGGQGYNKRGHGVRRHTVAEAMVDSNLFQPYFPSTQQVTAPAVSYADVMPQVQHQHLGAYAGYQYYAPAPMAPMAAYYGHAIHPHPHHLSGPGGMMHQQAPTSKQKTGPVGANLFVFNFPRIFSNADLEQAFEPFGTVLSATVFIDKVTQRSKCFGFVSYDSPEAAQLAINKMNGAQLGGKVIKVQLKREGGHRSNPQETTASA